MKKVLGFIFIMVTLASCVEPNVGYPGRTHIDMNLSKKDSLQKDTLKYPMDIKVEFSAIPLTVVLIDSCEYLYGPWGNGSVLTHKGNCVNPEHKQK
jgi:hypothetical protein